MIHFRDPARRTRALCGDGYDWASTIALRDTWDEVTCRACKRIGKVEEFIPEPDAVPPF